MTGFCGARLSDGHWPCILLAGHKEPWHMTLFGWTWVGDDPATYREGFPPVPGDPVMRPRSSIHSEESA